MSGKLVITHQLCLNFQLPLNISIQRVTPTFLTTVARPRCPTIAVVATLGVNTGTVIVARIIETFINI